MSTPLTERINATHLHSRAVGAFHGAALGDAIGGATEGFTPEQIRERWGSWVTGIVDPYYPNWQTARPHSPLHKADGHITDDTIMTHLLAKVYGKVERHLDAYDIADHLVPEIMTNVMWIPELEKDTVPILRLFLAEKYLALRLEWAHADPREAGVGNAVNCGAAMYMTPVGVVNAGDPDSAYREAIDLAGAHQLSYGREAAGVMAAAVAAAATPGATLDDVFTAALRLAKDGTREAIAAVLDAADSFDSWESAIESGGLRAAIRSYDTVADTYRQQGLGARRPSRIHAIEELPIALGMLKITNGSLLPSVFGGTNYGRDSDSIASMAGAIAGALNGCESEAEKLVHRVSEASRWDLTTPALDLADVALRIRVADADEAARQRVVLDALQS